MNTPDQQTPIEAQTGPDDIINTETNSSDAEKNNVQEELEGSEPSEDETKVNPEDANFSRSE